MKVGVKAQGRDDGQIGCNAPCAVNRRFDFVEVAHRLNHQQIDAPFDQALHLFGKERFSLGHRQRANRLNQLAGGANRTGDQHTGRCGDLFCQLHPGAVQFHHPILQIVQFQPGRGAAKGIGLDQISTGINISLIDRTDFGRLGDIPQFGCAAIGQAGLLQHGAHCAVTNQDAPCRQPFEHFGVSHCQFLSAPVIRDT